MCYTFSFKHLESLAMTTHLQEAVELYTTVHPSHLQGCHSSVPPHSTQWPRIPLTLMRPMLG